MGFWEMKARFLAMDEAGRKEALGKAEAITGVAAAAKDAAQGQQFASLTSAEAAAKALKQREEALGSPLAPPQRLQTAASAWGLFAAFGPSPSQPPLPPPDAPAPASGNESKGRKKAEALATPRNSWLGAGDMDSLLPAFPAAFSFAEKVETQDVRTTASIFLASFRFILPC